MLKMKTELFLKVMERARELEEQDNATNLEPYIAEVKKNDTIQEKYIRKAYSEVYRKQNLVASAWKKAVSLMNTEDLPNIIFGTSAVITIFASFIIGMLILRNNIDAFQSFWPSIFVILKIMVNAIFVWSICLASAWTIAGIVLVSIFAHYLIFNKKSLEQ